MSWKKFFLDLLFPINCVACRAPADWLCPKCFSKLKFNEKKYSLLTPYITKTLIAGDYEDKLLSQLIKQLKFHNLAPLGPILGRFLCAFWNFKKPAFLKLWPVEKILVLPIPLSKKRQRARGFNQAEIIAQVFSETFHYELNRDLKRIKHRPAQSSLDEQQRAKNIKDVFVWPEKDSRGRPLANFLVNRPLILVDDIITTGATLNEAARVLKAAGAKEIYALVLAKG